MARLRDQYREEVVPELMKEFGYSNVMQVPQLKKIVVNIGLGEAISNAKALEAAVDDLSTITGQRPVVTRAKKSIAAFKLRAGMPIGAMVTLRGPRMYEFFDRLVSITLPRIRDFRGVSPNSFDGRGNYTLGLSEQLAFPEIDYDKIDKTRGLELSLVTSARTDEEGRRLLALLGMPFARTEQPS
jgi:large subunit ribosomal protein L5